MTKVLCVTLMPLLAFHMAGGCTLRAQSEAGASQAYSQQDLMQLVQHKLEERTRRAIPKVLENIWAGLADPDALLADTSTLACKLTMEAHRHWDAINLSIEFDNNVCEIDPEVFCADGGPYFQVEIVARRPNLAMLLDEADIAAFRDFLLQPLFAELRARGHEKSAEWLEWATADVSSDSAHDFPLLAGVSMDMLSQGTGSSKWIGPVLLALLCFAVVAVFVGSSRHVTDTLYRPNIVAVDDPTQAPLPEDHAGLIAESQGIQAAGKELEAAAQRLGGSYADAKEELADIEPLDGEQLSAEQIARREELLQLLNDLDQEVAALDETLARWEERLAALEQQRKANDYVLPGDRWVAEPAYRPLRNADNAMAKAREAWRQTNERR